MTNPATISQDVRHALRLASLGFEREAARLLDEHSSHPAAEIALKALSGMTPGDARRAFEAMPCP